MNPYQALHEKAFWKPAVASKHAFDIGGLWDPKFNIQPADKVATYGSCFAQHIGRSLKSRGYGWLITEKTPAGLSSANKTKYNYEVFSSRTGNIYTTSLLRQWTDWALGGAVVPKECWEENGGFFDPFRPAVEPGGFGSRAELEACRSHTIECFRKSVEESAYFVFTLGLTEHWTHKGGSFEYPMCPGTAAGTFDPVVHQFGNHAYQEVREQFLQAAQIMRRVNPALKFLLTVSPVPLTATMSGEHVVVATMHSKSILRAVAGQLAADYDYIDYFPSYEIINSPCFRGMFFEPNLRSVNRKGVEFVMDSFFHCLGATFGQPTPLRAKKKGRTVAADKDVVCEEELLGSFSKQGNPS
ncbi:MAG: GSCFA domain-containing protein [Verrucomicrobiota bacterium]